MFLVEDKSSTGRVNHVFLHTDPRKQEGFSGVVKEEGVTLDYDLLNVHSWPDGEYSPLPCLARDPKNPKNYKVFKTEDERLRAGFDLVASSTPSVYNYWREYTSLRNGD